MMSQLGSTSHHLTPYLQIEHEETCEYRPYQCPCPGASCKWQGSLEQVITQHQSISHILIPTRAINPL